MNARIDPTRVNPGVIQAILGLEKQVRQAGFDQGLLDLVRMRASQINGCSYCLDMHSKDARANGETEQRFYGLVAWRETPYYSPRERAALEWTEALTLVAEGHVPDEVYERVWKQFSEEELVHLSLAIASINGFNRLSIAFRTVPGDYVPGSLTTLRGVSVSPISNPCLPANSHFTRQTTVKHTFASLSNPVFDARQTPEAGGPSTTSSPRLSKSGTAWSLQMTL